MFIFGFQEISKTAYLLGFKPEVGHLKVFLTCNKCEKNVSVIWYQQSWEFESSMIDNVLSFYISESVT